MATPITIVVSTLLTVGAIYYRVNGNKYRFINDDKTYNLEEICRYINEKFIGLPIKAIYSELYKKIKLVYRSATEEDIYFLSISDNNFHIILTPEDEYANTKSVYYCGDINEFIKQLNIMVNDFNEIRERFTFKEKQKFMNKINQSFKNKCYVETTDWKYIYLYKSSDNSKLAQIYIDNKLNKLKVEHNKYSMTFDSSKNIESIATAVVYYVAFTFNNSILVENN